MAKAPLVQSFKISFYHCILTILCSLLINYQSKAQSSDLIATGQFHSLSVHTDGTLWGWGSNVEGQLGLGSLISSDNPSKVENDNDWSTVSVGDNFSMVIKDNGSLWAMGKNDFGELGDGSTSSKNTPTQVGSDSDWESVSCGQNHVLALKTDGTLWSWGRNDWGQLGLGNTSNQSSPIQIGSDSDWVHISTSSESSFALKTDGTMWSWGRNGFDNGVLGYSSASDVITSPQQIGNDSDWKEVEAGYRHALATKTNGTLWAWGINQFGQIGNGTYSYQKLPNQIGSDTDWGKANCGHMHSFAIKDNGTLWTWGNNAFGQSNPSTTGNNNTPQQFNSDENWLAISGGETHTVSMKDDLTLRTWGNNYNGQLGGGTYIWNIPTPLETQLDDNANSIFSGGHHSIAKDSNGQLWYWGFNNFSNYFTLNIHYSANKPILISNDSDWNIIKSGNNFNAMIKNDGTLWVWGNNDKGQLGNGEDGLSSFEEEPIQVLDGTTWSNLSCGSRFVMAIRSDGTLWAWGENVDLGNGTNIDDSNVPIQISSDTDWSEVACGDEHALLIKNDGSLWSWGINNNGSLGNGSMFTPNLVPTRIGTDNDWQSISAGNNHSLAIRNNGTLWSWGIGPLGYTSSSQLTPRQVGNDTNWGQVDASNGDFSLGIKTNGTLWSWGNNTFGQLGDTTFNNRMTPVQIGSDTNWEFVSGGAIHSTALKTDGTVWSWGSNSRGQLGVRNSIIEIDLSTLSVNIPSNLGKLVLYPNPTGRFLTIETLLDIEDVYLYSYLGKKFPLSLNSQKIDLGNVPNGVYLIKVRTKQGVLIRKIVLQK